MKDFLTSVFPNYTDAMCDGDQPCGKGHELTDGGYADRWECWYGGGETSGESVLFATIYFNYKVSLFVCGNLLRITDIRYSGKPDVWIYDSNGDITLPATPQNSIHQLEAERTEKILSSNLPGRFWHLVQKRALEIYNQTKRTD